MSNIKTESGIKFLARIKNPESSLQNLEDSLFFEKLKEKDIVELMSDSIYSKNVLLMHLLKQAVLIDSFKDIQIDALNSGVLFIDTAFQFDLRHFSNYLQKYVNVVNAISSFTPSDKEAIVKKSLENLVYVPCYDSQQLLATFYNLGFTVLSNPKIRLVVLDNVAANYWQDSVNGGLRRMDFYEKKVVCTLQKCSKDLKLPILYVRPDFFVSKHPSGCGISNYRISVRNGGNDKAYLVHVKTKTKQIQKAFVVSDEGLKWTS